MSKSMEEIRTLYNLVIEKMERFVRKGKDTLVGDFSLKYLLEKSDGVNIQNPCEAHSFFLKWAKEPDATQSLKNYAATWNETGYRSKELELEQHLNPIVDKGINAILQEVAFSARFFDLLSEKLGKTHRVARYELHRKLLDWGMEGDAPEAVKNYAATWGNSEQQILEQIHLHQQNPR